jgi:hypothetical protein
MTGHISEKQSLAQIRNKFLDGFNRVLPFKAFDFLQPFKAFDCTRHRERRIRLPDFFWPFRYERIFEDNQKSTFKSETSPDVTV